MRRPLLLGMIVVRFDMICGQRGLIPCEIGRDQELNWACDGSPGEYKSVTSDCSVNWRRRRRRGLRNGKIELIHRRVDDQSASVSIARQIERRMGVVSDQLDLRRMVQRVRDGKDSARGVAGIGDLGTRR